MVDQGDPKEGGQGGQAVEVDGKAYTADDVKGLLSQAKTVTEKSQLLSQVENFAGKYGLEVDDLLQNAEGAFTVVSDLMKEGVIDESGKPITKESKVEPKPVVPKVDPKPEELKGGSPVEDIVKKALGDMLGPIQQGLEELSTVQTGMIRQDLERQIKTKHPNLAPEDVSQIFGRAMNDKTKDLWTHAKEASDLKGTHTAEQRKKFAEEFGINLEEYDRNKLEEQEAGGGAAAVVKGKKISFRGGKDTISPLKASMEFLGKQRNAG